MKKPSVLVGLSGGVDSSMTALILRKEGYEVTGVQFRFTDSYGELSGELIERLGIPFFVHDARALFRNEVIDYFTSFYLKGYTPSPCAHCNPRVKWYLLEKLASERGIDYIATGHYIRIADYNGSKAIFRGTDSSKDQSYYLWGLDQELFSKMLTPLGEMFKSEVKQMAVHEDFDFLLHRRESAGLCFAEGENCASLLARYDPDLHLRVGEGEVCTKDGKKIGRHRGYCFYTIGQKKGLYLDEEHDFCVAGIDATNNRLVVDRWENLYAHRFSIGNGLFTDEETLLSKMDISVMIRGFGMNPAGHCSVIRKGTQRYEVTLDEPCWAPAPGQPAVFYHRDRLLGGGLIDTVKYDE